jgi:DNA repair exonuclease SbcCD ATPase subunit
MILHGIELEGVGPFRERVVLGPFGSGLNILSAPNESGKTTSLRAAARALFDKHTTKGDELKSLQPAGTDLSPRVAVDFSTAAGRFRIEKTFLNAPRSLLQKWQDGRWEPVADADTADRRVQELLRSSLPGRGATKPEHWGLLGFLWARQGEAADWPDLAGDSLGPTIRARLARVEMDPLIDRLRQRLQSAAEEHLTSTGQIKKNGPLGQAEAELAAIDESLAALSRTRAEMEATGERYQTALAAAARLEKEHAERTVAAQEIHALAVAAEKGRAELDQRQAELTTAQTALQTVSRDAETHATRRAELAAAATALAQAEESAKVTQVRLESLRAEIDKTQDQRPARDQALAALRAAHQRAQSFVRLRSLTTQSATLARQADNVAAAAAALAALREKQTRLPAVTPAILRRLEELSEKIRTLAAQVEALGLAVELTPERNASVSDGAATFELPAHQSTRLLRPQTLDLHLEGWGRIVIRSGATEARDIASDLASATTRLAAALQEAGVSSVETARETVTALKELDAEMKAAASHLAQHLGSHANADALNRALAEAQQKAGSLAGTLAPTSEESARASTAWDAEEARLAEAIPAAEKILRACDEQLTTLRRAERDAAAAVEKSSAATAELRARRQTLESQIADLAARYPAGLDAAKTQAQLAFTQAEARAAAARAALPPDFEKLPERSRRAASALQQLANELQARRAERDTARGALESLGGQGLYSRETELEEKKAEILLRRDAARDLAWSARIAHDLLEFRKQAATRAVLAPLEDRLSAAFAELSGQATRRVFLDENLQIAGLGRTREELHAFDLLSQGAREQLLLCLRLAVAQELATDEPQVLILDDVLVNTDPIRQERVLDLLGRLTPNLQILILTCHPDRYRGVGEAVRLGRA